MPRERLTKISTLGQRSAPAAARACELAISRKRKWRRQSGERSCPRCLRCTLQERKLAKSSGPSSPAPYQGVDSDAGRTRGRIAPKNSSLFPVSAQSERLATSSFRIRSTFVHRGREDCILSACCGVLWFVLAISPTALFRHRRRTLASGRLETGHCLHESNDGIGKRVELAVVDGEWVI